MCGESLNRQVDKGSPCGGTLAVFLSNGVACTIELWNIPGAESWGSWGCRGS